MLPSDMNLRIRDSVAGYNNKILISKKGFSVGKNQKVNNNNLTVMSKPKAVVTAPATPKPTTPVVDKVATTPATPTDAITTEEEVVLGVTLAIIAAVIMIYK